MRALETYSWPGNVRELENTIQRACVLATSDMLLPANIPLGSAHLDRPPEAMSESYSNAPITTERAIEVLLDAARSDPNVELLPWLEREFTIHAMQATRGNQVQASKLLGITRATLRKRLERFAITKELTIQ